MPHDALCFYNSGPASGASQPHKHVQIIPLPLIPDAPATGATDPPLLPLVMEATEG
jgi:ATP adenylyltransferase